MTLSGIPAPHARVSYERLPVGSKNKNLRHRVNFLALPDEEASEVELALV